jgi:imidazole glycerol phosphate synthase subunit HisF
MKEQFQKIFMNQFLSSRWLPVVLLAGKADASLAASIFHFGTFTVGDVKQFLAKGKIPVRL